MIQRNLAPIFIQVGKVACTVGEIEILIVAMNQRNFEVFIPHAEFDFIAGKRVVAILGRRTHQQIKIGRDRVGTTPTEALGAVKKVAIAFSIDLHRDAHAHCGQQQAGARLLSKICS